MQQRAEDPLDGQETELAPVETTTTEPRGLTTADLAGTIPPRPQMGPPDPTPHNVTPIGPQVRATSASEGPHASVHQEDGEYPAMFKPDDAEGFRSRWTDIQAGFVDEPRQAVELADGLVADTIQRLAEVFAEERTHLEGQWSRGEDVSTEDLRVALRHYRSFFDRLLRV